MRGEAAGLNFTHDTGAGDSIGVLAQRARKGGAGPLRKGECGAGPGIGDSLGLFLDGVVPVEEALRDLQSAITDGLYMWQQQSKGGRQSQVCWVARTPFMWRENACRCGLHRDKSTLHSCGGYVTHHTASLSSHLHCALLCGDRWKSASRCLIAARLRAPMLGSIKPCETMFWCI